MSAGALGIAASALGAGQNGLRNYAGSLAKSQVKGSTPEDTVFIGNPGGVTITSVNNRLNRAGNDYTGNEMDLSIEGEKGYYVVRGTDGNVGLKSTVSLNIGPGGTLIDDEGNEILAWPTLADGTIDPAQVTNQAQIDQLQPIIVDTVALSASATTQASLGVNLPAFVANAPTPAGHVENVQVEVYDSLGNSRTATYRFEKMAIVNGSPNADNDIGPSTWDLTINVAGADSVQAEGTADDYHLRIVFDNLGNPASFARIDGTPNALPIPGGANAQLPNIVVNWTQTDTAIAPNTVSLDLTRISSIGNTFSSTNNTVDGLPVGSVNGVSFNDGGVASLSFDNGLTRPIALIPLGTVPTVNKLKDGDSNRLFSTAESGAIVLSPPKVGGYAAVAPKNLQGSSIDPARVLTSMIEIQNYVSANSTSFGINLNVFREVNATFKGG